MKLHYLFSAASAAVLICGAAYAQDSGSAASQSSVTGSAATPDSMSQDSSNSVNPPAASSATDPAMGGAASSTAAPPAATGMATNTAASAGANVTERTITNGPVPDTAENRERFPPLSATGRRTKPSGN